MKKNRSSSSSRATASQNGGESSGSKSPTKNEVVVVLEALGALEQLIANRARQDFELLRKKLDAVPPAETDRYTYGNFLLDIIQANTRLITSYLQPKRAKA